MPLSITYPYSFVNGTVIDANQVDANFAAVNTIVGQALPASPYPQNQVLVGQGTAPAAPTSNLALDASGNTLAANSVGVGGGAIPSPATPSVIFPATGTSVVAGSAGGSAVAANLYFDYTSWRYRVAGAGALYNVLGSGVHTWSAAPSGGPGAVAAPTQTMSLDASGNLTVAGGVGVGGGAIPSPATPSVIFPATGTSVVAGSAGGSAVAANLYYDNASWRYRVAGAGALYNVLGSGTHTWSAAVSGSAGNIATPTQTMSLDASGNLTVSGTLGTANGQIGQRITSGNLTTTPAATGVVFNIGSIVLPAGDWDVEGIATFSATTALTTAWLQLSTTSLDNTVENQDVNPRFRASYGSGVGNGSVAVPASRFVGPATVYLVADLTYTGTATTTGARISARRWA